ncbi:RsmB/NOP family class I SAM-dependent RNA methyltransferase [Candidatus Woesearchaeota archaeon]|nr:RsmB/NOP family class I SAM-dependent RNA methyltransferase [Candidatus Woesearchaeota archaeon]
MERVVFKPAFIERYQQLTDYPLFEEYSRRFLRRSLRVNTLKRSIAEVKDRLQKEWSLTPIPWCADGFWIDHKGKGEEYRRDIGNTVEHQLGYIYIQEAASMIPPVVLQPTKGDVVLDVCASPGSKTSQIAAMMENTGVIIANDVSGERLKALGINIQRMGITNTVITLNNGMRFPQLMFDKILLDAPCSGTGAIRKSFKILTMWNPGMVKRLARVQQKLLERAFALLHDNGVLVYSTCSCEPEENEGVIDTFLTNHLDAMLEEITLPLKTSPAIMEFEGKTYTSKVEKCLRIWPQDNDTEGFFVTKIRKR